MRNAWRRLRCWRQSKVFFFEKKKQKAFVYLLTLSGNDTPNKQKFLNSFFKKEVLPSLRRNPNRVFQASYESSMSGEFGRGRNDEMGFVLGAGIDEQGFGLAGAGEA